MFDIPMPATALHRFVQEHYEPIQNAALLLGGQPWLWRMQRLLDHLQLTPTVAGYARCEAAAVPKLLTAERVHGMLRPVVDSVESLDSAASHVEEICPLTDRLSDTLEGWGAQQGAAVVGDFRGQADV